jgi:hypothetical protein
MGHNKFEINERNPTITQKIHLLNQPTPSKVYKNISSRH